MAAPAAASGIFISYRRADNPDAVGRIYDRLVTEFGKARVFKDVDSIPLGQDFRTHLGELVGSCAVVLTIIGPRWTDMRDAAGSRRLDDADDFVRIELETALARGVPVLPVLVGHASMPGTRELPASLASLAFRQAVEVRPDPDFHNDATRLVAALGGILGPVAAGRALPPDEVRTPEKLPAASAPAGRPHASRIPWLIAVAAGLAAAVLLLPGMNSWRRPATPEFHPDIATPLSDRPLDFALSPDGMQVVFVAMDNGVRRLWLRRLSLGEPARPLRGTDGAQKPFWSADGAQVAFFASAGLVTIDVRSGQMRTLFEATTNVPAGGSWNADGVILVALTPAGPLRQLSAPGSLLLSATELAPGEFGHAAPLFIADGRRFLFQARGSADHSGIYLGSLDGGATVRLVDGERPFAWLPSGWLVVGIGNKLVAQKLDIDKAQLVGEPVDVVVLDELIEVVNLAPNLSISVDANGVIAYRMGTRPPQQLQWFSRKGELLGEFGTPDSSLNSPRISPADGRVAVSSSRSGATGIYLLDGVRSTLLSPDPKREVNPLWWPPTGRELVYAADGLYRRSIGAADGETRLLGDSGSNLLAIPTGFSPDGRYLMLQTPGENGKSDLQVLRTGGNDVPVPWMRTPHSENWGVFSPDGKFIAYGSDESGQQEVYVREFVVPGEPGAASPAASARWQQVSVAGGVYPLWSPKGDELFFVDPQGNMMAAKIAPTAETISPGSPERLFPTRIAGGGTVAYQRRQYDVSRDSRFLVAVELEPQITRPISVILNWKPDRAIAH